MSAVFSDCGSCNTAYVLISGVCTTPCSDPTKYRKLADGTCATSAATTKCATYFYLSGTTLYADDATADKYCASCYGGFKTVAGSNN
jgi:hypothetical protein